MILWTKGRIPSKRPPPTFLRNLCLRGGGGGGALTRYFTVLSYLCPSLPVEHRPSTTPRHRALFWVALVIPDQLVPCCFSSASVSRLQLLRGRPLFLFPCGFQVRTWRVALDAGFLGVCPIQPHFLCRICLATGSCPARSSLATWTVFPVSYTGKVSQPNLLRQQSVHSFWAIYKITRNSEPSL